MADELKVTDPSYNQILVYDETQQAFVNVDPDLSLFGNTTFIQGGMNLGTSDGEYIFNNVVSNVMRFRRIRGLNGINLISSGSYIDIEFDGEASTLGGLPRSGYLEKNNNLSDADSTLVRSNIDVYSTGEADSTFMFANANNIPDVDATYDIGSNGRRYADMYAVTFHGLATESIISQNLERNGADNGDVLTWDTAEGTWIPKPSTTGRLSELVDVDLANIEHESVLVYNGVRNIWESAPLSSLGVISDGDTAGSITDAENVGNGVGTFFARFGGNLQFRSVTGGNNVNVSTNFNGEEIVIDADVPQDTDGLPEGTSNLYFTTQRVRDTLGSVSIQDLGSVNATSPVSGQAPVWNGSEWVFTDVATNLDTTDDLAEGSNNLYYESQRVYTDIGEYLVDVNYGISLNEISDVDALQSAGTFLYSDGTTWNNREIVLSDISNINLTGLSDGSTIVYNSGSGEFQVGQFPQNLIDLGETTDSLHFNSVSFDSFFSQKTTDNLTETPQNKFLNNTNLVNELQNISINQLVDVDTTGVSDNNVLVWSSSESAFVPADSSSLNVTVNMGIEDLNNVNESSVINAQDGYGLVYNSTSGTFEFSDITQSISELSDVSASGITNGDVLVYQSGTYVPQGILPYNTSIVPSDGNILQFNGTTGQYESVDGNTLGVENLSDLADVTITNIADGQIVVYDGALSQYVNKNIFESIELLNLQDVNASGITSGQTLVYDGNDFVAQNYLRHALTSPTDGQVLTYDSLNSRFVNTSITDAIGIDTSASIDGYILQYNSTSGVYESNALNISALSDVSEIAAPSSGVAYTMVWDGTSSSYQLRPVSDVISLQNLNGVDLVEEVDGSGVFFNSSTGTYEIRKSQIQEAGDVNFTTLSDGDAIVWDATNSEFVNGFPSVSVEQLSNVSSEMPSNGDSIVWNGSEYIKAKVELSYDEIVKVTNAYEYWNFNEDLIGTINDINIVPDTGYSYETGIGVKGSTSIYSGTSYDINSGTEAKSLSATIGSFAQAESYQFSYDFWYQPTTNVAYQGTPEDAIVMRMNIVADTLASEEISVEFVIVPDGTGSFEHRIRVVKNGTIAGSYAVTLNDSIFNHVVVNYYKNGTNTDINVIVNTNDVVDQTVSTVIGDDSSYSVNVQLLQELEIGSQAYSIDNFAVYNALQTPDVIERKYKNVVTNGYTYIQPSVYNLSGIELTNTSSGDLLVYDGTNFANRTIAINELSDVDTTGITTGQVLQFDGTGFVPFTITDQVGATQLSELNDVDSALAPSDGETLVYNSTSGQFEMGLVSSVNSIEDLDNVDETVTPQDNQVLTYNAGTQQYEPRDPAAGSQSTSDYEFTASQDQTVFVLEHDNDVMVFANGFLLPTSEVDAATSTSEITLTSPRNSGDTIRVLVLHDPATSQTNTQATVTNAVEHEFVMVQDQTVIPFNHSGNVMVFANGILLRTNAVDTSDPTQITLTTARNAGDTIRIVNFVQV